ncbi:MAG: hypothetical protein HXS44_06265 [Theionarchaea archaeon]|nr:hypothetical protein [Theionarchaea archaeon]
MDSKNPGKRIPGWAVALPVVFVLIVRVVQSYLVEKGKNDLALERNLFKEKIRRFFAIWKGGCAK